MTDRRNRRDTGPRQRAGDDFLIERPQILQRPAAARDDDHIDEIQCVEMINCRRNLPADTRV